MGVYSGCTTWCCVYVCRVEEIDVPFVDGACSVHLRARSGSSWSTRRIGPSKVAQLHRASILAPSGSTAAPRSHVAGTTVRSEKRMAHIMAHLDVSERA